MRLSCTCILEKSGFGAAKSGWKKIAIYLSNNLVSLMDCMCGAKVSAVCRDF